MGKELVPVGPVYDGEAYEFDATATFEDYIDVLPVVGDEVTTPLDEQDEAALADGIASVFDALRAEAADEGSPAGTAGNDNEETTYALLAELNRLWAEPLAA